MKITIEKIDENIQITLGDTPMSLSDVVDLTLNGLRAFMEESVTLIMKGNPKITEQEARSEIHDQLVVSFSAMMYVFDPKSKNYKKVE